MKETAIRKAQGRRLAKARAEAGYRSARAAAHEFGWPESTYRAHEAGTRTIGQDDAGRYARALRTITARGILFGDGVDTPDGWYPATVVGRIGAGNVIEPDFEQLSSEGLYEIELPIPVPPDAVAFEVDGQSMWPRYDPGDVIVCSREGIAPENVLHFVAAVRTEDGRRFLKRVLPGARPGTYDLESFNAEPIRGVGLAWVGEILATVPANRVRNANGKQMKALARQIAKAVR